MNKRSIVFWKISLVISVIISIIIAYQNFESYQLTLELWDEYINQEIGTDNILKNKVHNIESNLSVRESFKFNIDDPPTDLSNVIVFDGFDPRFSGSSKYIYVTAIISSKDNNKHLALVRFRDNEYTVSKGDSIAGGYISSITEKEVFFIKKDKKYKFYKGLDTSLDDNESIITEEPADIKTTEKEVRNEEEQTGISTTEKDNAAKDSEKSESSQSIIIEDLKEEQTGISRIDKVNATIVSEKPESSQSIIIEDLKEESADSFLLPAYIINRLEKSGDNKEQKNYESPVANAIINKLPVKPVMTKPVEKAEKENEQPIFKSTLRGENINIINKEPAVVEIVEKNQEQQLFESPLGGKNINILNKEPSVVEIVEKNQEQQLFESPLGKKNIDILNPSQPVEKIEVTADPSKFSLQAGAFSKRENAELIKNNLATAGFSTDIIEHTTNRHTLYIVKVGLYNDLTSARTAKQQISAALNIETIIINNN